MADNNKQNKRPPFISWLLLIVGLCIIGVWVWIFVAQMTRTNLSIIHLSASIIVSALLLLLIWNNITGHLTIIPWLLLFTPYSVGAWLWIFVPQMTGVNALIIFVIATLIALLLAAIRDGKPVNVFGSLIFLPYIIVGTTAWIIFNQITFAGMVVVFLFLLIASIIALLSILIWRAKHDTPAGNNTTDKHWLDKKLGAVNKSETIKRIAQAIGALILAGNACGFIWNAVAQQENAKAAQENVQQQVYNDALTLLANEQSVSARIGGIYGLAAFAKQNPLRKENICDILSAHVREITQEEKYEENNAERPSNEIQSLLNVVAKQGIFEGGCRDFSRANLWGLIYRQPI